MKSKEFMCVFYNKAVNDYKLYNKFMVILDDHRDLKVWKKCHTPHTECIFPAPNQAINIWTVLAVQLLFRVSEQ